MMMTRTGILVFPVCLLLLACQQPERTIEIDGKHVQCELIAEDGFESGLDRWIVEQRPGGSVSLIDGKMDIDDLSGCTAWFREKFKGNIMIEYEASVIDSGGANDRVSDLNCFWMAKDFNHPEDFFANSEMRNGKFQNYHDMQLYYVGLGGHDNTKTRFRRYAGGGERPVLPEHDLSDQIYLIQANKVNMIRLVVYNTHIQYYFNGMLVFDVEDPDPYSEGYFGIRTYKNHMTVDNLKVYALK